MTLLKMSRLAVLPRGLHGTIGLNAFQRKCLVLKSRRQRTIKQPPRRKWNGFSDPRGSGRGFVQANFYLESPLLERYLVSGLALYGL